MNSSVKNLTRSALSAAAGLVVLYLSCILPWGRLGLMCIATLGVIFVRMSCSCGWALGCFAVTALLGLILLPAKAPALAYALFLGYYPLLRIRIERVADRVLRLALKLASFNTAAAVIWFGFRFFFSDLWVGMKMPVYLLWIAANGAFLVYDYALGQIMLYYVRNIAGRIK